jgi:hypothetical protein
MGRRAILPWRNTPLALQWIVRSGRSFLLYRDSADLVRRQNSRTFRRATSPAQVAIRFRFPVWALLRPVEQLPLRSMLLGGFHFCPTAKLHRYHCSLVQLFKNTKVRWVLQVTSRDACCRKACFFNDLSESTKVVDGLQGRALLKRRFVVEKWVGGWMDSVYLGYFTGLPDLF